MASKSEKQIIQELLASLESRTRENADLFQELLVLLKKNSKIILQFVSDNLDRFLEVLESEIEIGETNPSVFTSYGFLAHHETISKQYSSIHVERFFRIVLKQTNLSKKSLSLAVWCLGVQRFSSQVGYNVIEPHSNDIFNSIHVGIKNPYQSHVTTAEALNTLSVLLNQLQDISAKYVTIWFIDVIECLLSPHKTVCLAAEKITDSAVFKNMVPFNNNVKFKISDKDLAEISKNLFSSIEDYQKMLKQNLSIPVYDTTQIQVKPITNNGGGFYAWNQILPELANRQQIIAFKAWGLILYFLEKNISKDNVLTNLNEIIKPKLSLKLEDSQTSSSQTSKNLDIVNNMLVCECIEHSWTMLIQLMSSHSKIHAKGRLSLLIKPLLVPLKNYAQGYSNPSDRKLREICYQKIILHLLPEAEKDISLFFENLLKPLFIAVSSKETADYALQEQLVLFLGQWLFNDQRDNFKARKKRVEALSQEDLDEDIVYRHFLTGTTFINDISFLVRKDFSYLFSSSCLKQDGLFICQPNTKASDALQRLEFFATNIKVFFNTFFFKLVAGFVKSFNQDTTDQTIENSKRFSKTLNFYFRSLCQVIVSYLRNVPKDMNESDAEKYSTLLVQLITSLLTFCVENVLHYTTSDSSPLLEEWIQEMSLTFIKSFVECLPVNLLISGTCNSIKAYIDVKTITNSIKDSLKPPDMKKSPFFALIYCLYRLAFSAFNNSPTKQYGDKICEMIQSCTAMICERLLVDLQTIPNLYNEPIVLLMTVLLEDLILTHQEVCVISKTISSDTLGLTKLLECQMGIWKKYCSSTRDEIRTVDTCFSLMISKSGDANLPNTSTETLQKRKKQAQELKTYLCKQNPENQKQSDSGLTSKVLTPEFLPLMEKLIFYPFDLFGCKLTISGNIMSDETKAEFSIESHQKLINTILSNDSEVLHILKEMLVLFGTITSNTNMPPFHYISKHLKNNLSHHHLQKISEDLLEKLNCQYLCILSELEKEDINGITSTSYVLMRSWILFGTKILSLLCTVCHESQRFKVSILSIPSGKSTIHNLQLLLKTFVWMIFDYRRQFSKLSDPFFDLITQLMSELKNILSLSRSAQHSIQFAQEYAEEILFDKDFTTLFELQGSFLARKNQTIVYSTEEMLQFATLCENIWEGVFNQVSKWCLQDGVVFDQNMLNQMEKVLVIGLDSKRNSKVKRITTQFWTTYFSQSKSSLSYSPSLKQAFSSLLQKGEISRADLPNFPFDESDAPKPAIQAPTSTTESKDNKRKRVDEVKQEEQVAVKEETDDTTESNKKKLKLTKSQKEKMRERKETRLVVPEMNPSLLSSSLLSIDDSDEEVDQVKVKTEPVSNNLLNISDIVSAPVAPSNNNKPTGQINLLNDSSMIDIKDIPVTPKKENDERMINLVTPDFNRVLNLSPIMEKEDEKETTSSVEDLFNKLESGCTPKQSSSSSSSCSITFTAPENQIKIEKVEGPSSIVQTTPEKTSFEDDETQITQTSAQKHSNVAVSITPILKKSPLRPQQPVEILGEKKKHVRFVSDHNLTFTEHLNALEALISTKNIGDLFSSKEEKAKAALKLHSLLGNFLIKDE